MHTAIIDEANNSDIFGWTHLTWPSLQSPMLQNSFSNRVSDRHWIEFQQECL